MLWLGWFGMDVLAAESEEGPPAADAPAEAEPWDRRGWGFGGLPAINYNSDEGFGFGVVGSAYRYNGELRPYRTAINLVLFMSTKAVHTHSLEVDTLQLLDAPVRLTVRGEFSATKTSNYCGLGPEVTCDPEVARDAVDAEIAAGALDPAEREDAVRRYYRTRFLTPNAQVNVRWTLDPMPHRLELVLGWRGRGVIPGDFQERAPWPGSLYAQDYPGGERGFVSALQAGAMLDNRDNEPAPTRGYWIEGTVRAASKIFGSTYTHFGWNATLRGYLPLGTERLVLADRAVFDGLVGDAPTVELAEAGGTQRYTLYGSLNAGRGIRLRRYVGKLKLMNQTELRGSFWRPTVAGVELDLTALTFLDLGFVGAETGDFGPALSHPLPGTGGGLRIAFDRNFVVRADVGVSPIEDWSPSVYIDLRNVF